MFGIRQVLRCILLMPERRRSEKLDQEIEEMVNDVSVCTCCFLRLEGFNFLKCTRYSSVFGCVKTLLG